MMKKNNFDDELKAALMEYVKGTKVTTDEKFQFSKEHEEKMQKLFDDLEKAAELNSANTCKNQNNISRFPINRFIKVAVFILLAILAFTTITPSMMAWKTEKLGLYGENQDEYSRVLQGNISEVLENKVEDKEKYIKFFNYLPEGYEIKRAASTSVSEYVEVNVGKNNFSLKVFKKMNQAVDTEFSANESFAINGKEVIFLKKDGEYSFAWNHEGRLYRLNGNLDFDEMKKIIYRINYKEIEKNF